MITNETIIFNDIRRNIKLQRKYKPKYSKIFLDKSEMNTFEIN